MHLGGQASSRRSERGYAMAVLLVSLSVLAILMSVAMPVWKQASQREKEEEYLWRANQIVRGIVLFGRKRANAMPNSLDDLVNSNERYLRKKFKDPLTGDDFDLVRQGSQVALPGQIAGQPQRGNPAGGTSFRPVTPSAGAPGQGGQTFGGGPIIGVTSKSKAESVRIYKGRTHYNEWIVTTADYRSPLGGAAAQPGQPGAPGMPGRGGPGRGQPPFGPARGPINPRGGPPTGPGQPFPFPLPPGRGRGQ